MRCSLFTRTISVVTVLSLSLSLSLCLTLIVIWATNPANAMPEEIAVAVVEEEKDQNVFYIPTEFLKPTSPSYSLDLIDRSGRRAEQLPKKCLRSCSLEACDGNTTDIARFLFAGQSNMVGHSDQALHGLFNMTVDIVNKRFGVWKLKKFLRKLEIPIGNALWATPESAVYEADQIYKLAGRNKSRSVLKKETIKNPHPTAVCSFFDPSLSRFLDCERPVSPTACGYSRSQYGPELMFSHLFTKLETVYKNKPIGITKVAVGGTTISQWLSDNSSDNDSYWWALQDAIEAGDGTIEAFVWFQGENDQITKISTELYLQGLKTLVADVREEIFLTSKSKNKSIFTSKEDVPVVIVELGPWIAHGVAKNDGNEPGNVILAQRMFVKSDSNAILVHSGASENPEERLSAFYHFDAPSMLIIGERIAKGLKFLLDKNLD